MSGQKYRPLTAADGYMQEGDEFRCLNLSCPSRGFDWRPWLRGHHHSSIAVMLRPTYEARRPIAEDGPTPKELLDWVTSSAESKLLRGGVANPHEWYFNYKDADGRFYTGFGRTGREAVENAKKFYDKRHADVAAKEAQRQKDLGAYMRWFHGEGALLSCQPVIPPLDAFLAGLEAGRKEKA